jgi:hypothetical protein
VLRSALPRGLASAAALPTGCLAVSVQLLLLSWAHLPWSAPLLALPWLALAVATGWHLWRQRAGRHLRGLGPRLVAVWSRLALDERLVVVALVAVVMVLVVLAPLGLPYGDGLNFAYFKAHAYYVDGSILPYALHAASLAFSVPNHPPLVPLSITWLYLCVGHVDEHASLLLWPAMLASLLGAFFVLARTVASRRVALWSTLGLVLIATDLFAETIWASYSDMPLALIVLVACGLVWFAGDRAEHGWPALVLAGLLLGAAYWTKEEAIPLTALVLAASPLLRLPSSGAWSALHSWRVWRPLCWALPAWLVVTLPLLVFQRVYPAPEVTVSLSGMHLSALLSRLLIILAGVAGRILVHWWPVVALLGVWIVLRIWNGRSLLLGVTSRARFLLVVIVLQIAAYCLGMLTSPAEVHNALAWDANRLLSQVVPLVFLAGVCVWQPVEQEALRTVPAARSRVQALVAVSE